MEKRAGPAASPCKPPRPPRATFPTSCGTRTHPHGGCHLGLLSPSQRPSAASRPHPGVPALPRRLPRASPASPEPRHGATQRREASTRTPGDRNTEAPNSAPAGVCESWPGAALPPGAARFRQRDRKSRLWLLGPGLPLLKAAAAGLGWRGACLFSFSGIPLVCHLAGLQMLGQGYPRWLRHRPLSPHSGWKLR